MSTSTWPDARASLRQNKVLHDLILARRRSQSSRTNRAFWSTFAFVRRWLGPLAVPVWFHYSESFLVALVTAFIFIVFPADRRGVQARHATTHVALFGNSRRGTLVAHWLQDLPWLVFVSIAMAATAFVGPYSASLPWIDRLLAAVALGLVAPMGYFNDDKQDSAALYRIGTRILFCAGVIAAVTMFMSRDGMLSPEWQQILVVAGSLASVAWIATSLRASLAAGVHVRQPRSHETGSEAEPRETQLLPVAFHATTEHRPARSLAASFRMLWWQQIAFAWRANPLRAARPFAVVLSSFPWLMSVGFIGAFMTTRATADAAYVGVLWLAMIAMEGISQPMSGSLWLRGVSWRTQFETRVKCFFAYAYLPMLAGWAGAVAIFGATPGSLSTGALLAGGGLMRPGWAGIFGEDWATNRWILVPGVAFCFYGSYLLVSGVTLAAYEASLVGGAFAFIFGAGALRRWLTVDDATLGRSWRSADGDVEGTEFAEI